MPKSRLLERISLFHNGQWSDLVERSVVDSETTHFAACRKRRRAMPGIEQRATRALRCVLDGELSARRQALEGAELARPPYLRDPLPDRVVNHVPHTLVSLDPELFERVLRSSRRGAAAGPSGMTAEHLRPMLESTEDTESLASFADTFAKGEIPKEIVDAIRMGRITALRKLGGGVWWAISSVVWCPDREAIQQVEDATAPGCECVAHIFQSLTGVDRSTIVILVDGVAHSTQFPVQPC